MFIDREQYGQPVREMCNEIPTKPAGSPVGGNKNPLKEPKI